MKIRFAGDDWELISKVIDGTFPDYDRVIPARVENPGYAVLSLETLRRLPAPISDVRTTIKLDLSTATASSRDVVNDFEVEMPIEAHGDFAVGFASNYLREIARTFGTIRIEATSPNDAAHILTDDPDLTVVIMPHRI